MELSPTDHAQQRDLHRMKGVALALLIAAAIVFVTAKLHGGGGWVGYVRAFAEAAMVGALADWFAVTALFRHPLGLPIPHTAIIPRRKDQIGRSLGDFVENNFLTPELLNDRLKQAEVGRRVGAWCADPHHARTATGFVTDGVRGALEVFDDAELQAGLDSVVRRHVADTPAAPLVAKVIDISIEGGHHQRLLDATLTGLQGFVGENRPTFRTRLDQESPWWVPESIDDRVYDKIEGAVNRFIDEVRSTPNHDVRRSIEQRFREFSTRLKTDPDLIARGEQLKAELLDHPAFRSWVENLWERTKGGLLAATDNPDSALATKVSDGIRQLGERIVVEPELAAKIDHWVEQGVAYLVTNYRSEVSTLISSTVERWDGDSTAKRMELAVGKDLQFIRINGTLVGGLAGLLIHALSHLIG